MTSPQRRQRCTSSSMRRSGRASTAIRQHSRAVPLPTRGLRHPCCSSLLDPPSPAVLPSRNRPQEPGEWERLTGIPRASTSPSGEKARQLLSPQHPSSRTSCSPGRCSLPIKNPSSSCTSQPLHKKTRRGPRRPGAHPSSRRCPRSGHTDASPWPPCSATRLLRKTKASPRRTARACHPPVRAPRHRGGRGSRRTRTLRTNWRRTRWRTSCWWTWTGRENRWLLRGEKTMAGMPTITMATRPAHPRPPPPRHPPTHQRRSSRGLLGSDSSIQTACTTSL
mmetsp:Transcript_31720/g.92150  ORF Transcript_31720/g.92150 Transcript_31720/m.92150 type:complete len:279 (-) Transcript_31720:955-1791(-)